MSAVEPRLIAALQEQLRRRDALLREGAGRIGWKLGMGERERIGEHIAVGYLTTNTLIDADDGYRAEPRVDRELHVDTELCIEFGKDINQGDDPDDVVAAIRHCWPALEIVDLSPRANEPDSVVVDNVFHQAVAFGDKPIPMASDDQVMTYVNGRCVDRAPWPADLPDRIVNAVTVLASLNEWIRAGDRVITGSITQLSFAPGDLLLARFGPRAAVAVKTVV